VTPPPNNCYKIQVFQYARQKIKNGGGKNGFIINIFEHSQDYKNHMKRCARDLLNIPGNDIYPEHSLSNSELTEVLSSVLKNILSEACEGGVDACEESASSFTLEIETSMSSPSEDLSPSEKENMTLEQFTKYDESRQRYNVFETCKELAGRVTDSPGPGGTFNPIVGGV
jgi:hypothetical protein